MQQNYIYFSQNLVLDTHQCRFFFMDTQKPVDLTRQEFRVLMYLLDREGNFCTQDELLDVVWGEGEGSPQSLANVILKLRTKVPQLQEVIKTKHNQGYSLEREEKYRKVQSCYNTLTPSRKSLPGLHTLTISRKDMPNVRRALERSIDSLGYQLKSEADRVACEGMDDAGQERVAKLKEEFDSLVSTLKQMAMEEMHIEMAPPIFVREKEREYRPRERYSFTGRMRKNMAYLHKKQMEKYWTVIEYLVNIGK